MRHEVKLSLAELKGRVSGGPNYVRVGLPDSVSTQEGDQTRKERGQGRRRRK
jgi:hypothetical protein